MLLGGYEKFQKRKVWKEYAGQGDVYAQWELAESYCCSSLEGGRDYNQALYWYCKAAENGHADAQTKIADLYVGNTTLGPLKIKYSKVDAYVWYSLAARRIHGEAIDARLALIDDMSELELKQAELQFQDYDNLTCQTMIDISESDVAGSDWWQDMFAILPVRK